MCQRDVEDKITAQVHARKAVWEEKNLLSIDWAAFATRVRPRVEI